MPIYDYICKDCQHETEVFLKVGEQGPSHCPKCDKQSFERMLSAPKFRLGGSGWYETDEKPKSKQRNIANSESTAANTSKE